MLPGLRTTHDWTHDVLASHVARLRADAAREAPELLHLVLEVLAYPLDEALDGLTRHVWIERHDDGSVTICDDGRGTDTRTDATGAPVVKPIMATPDLRFLDAVDAPVLADGRSRSGLSAVCAVSCWLEHVNRRATGAWSRRYEHGLPAGPTRALAPDGTTGTTVRFLPDAAFVAASPLDLDHLRALVADAPVPVDVVG
ncbi:hypothetical protein ACHAAC_07765 [Aeromicrobium sp. CF4.19]|uniref:hypothetical protein n=1 Tax=Aeromicrobium sp. CF4.19 TaxID=3373082 RepID=UPI003EE4A176